MSRTSTAALAATILAVLAAALPVVAVAAEPSAPAPSSTPDREAEMDAAMSTVTVDPALAAWRDAVLPGIRAFLAAEREALTAMSVVKSDDPEAQRERHHLCEERKLLGEREIALRQLAWAEAYGRAPLAARLRSRVVALEAAWPGLPAAAARTYGSDGARIGADAAPDDADGGAR
jgi:hypothetical protein